MKAVKRMVFIAAILAGGVCSAAGDPPPAIKDKVATCAACHGQDGNSQTPDFPRLAGQYQDYLYRAMLDYKSGKRKNPIMAEQVKNLSQRDMQPLAAYFAGQQGLYVKK
ncbi:MAG: cytochrome c [Pseudomonadota bacterium]|jgi:cytochrome c553